MPQKTLKSQINSESLAALAVLIIFSFGMAWLVLSKTDDAIEEFGSINKSHVDVIKKNLADNDLTPPANNF